MNKEPVYFEVGDTVYHWNLGEGEVRAISGQYISIKFSTRIRTYYKDGTERRMGKPVISQTPYDFVNGGFTLKPKLPKIEKGTLVYVRIVSEWIMRYFSHYAEGGKGIHCFDCQTKSGCTSLWFIYSLTNPLLDE